MRVRKKSPIIRSPAAKLKMTPKIQRAFPQRSATCPATRMTTSDQKPNIRLRVPKNFPRMFMGTSSEMEADQATPQTALPRLETKTMEPKSRCLDSPIHGKLSTSSHGMALSTKVTAII